MLHSFLVAGAILLMRIGQDMLFLTKIDAFNRSNKYYTMSINFVEAIYGITVIKLILDLMRQNYFYVFVFGLGSMLGGLVVYKIKKKIEYKLQGQRKYFARISLENDIDRSELLEILTAHNFEFTVDIREYLNGKIKTVIQGSLDNRNRLQELKDILKGRPGKHVTILRADDIYLLN
jgi:hypothetical protein